MPVRTSELFVSTVVATAVAASGLVAATSAPSVAVPATTSYVCTFPELEEVEVPLTVDVTNLPAQLPVGIPVPANQWNVVANLHLDELTTGYLVGHTNAITATIQGLELLLADKPIPVGLVSGVETLPLAEALDVPMAGTNSEFTPKFWADDLSLELPEVFTVHLRDGAGAPLFSVDCEWGDGDLGVIGKVDVVKQSATLTGQLVKKPVKATKRPKLLVSVLDQTGTGAPGEVLAAIEGRNLAVGELVDGRVVLRLPKLPVGKHRITLSYLGSRNVEKAMTNVTVKVVRPKH